MSAPSETEDPRRGARELVTVFVLSITAVLTAWCGFESSKFGGEMSIAFSQASSARVRATDFESQARDARQLDVSIYSQWVSATAAEDAELADYVEERFTPTLRAAFDPWLAEGRPENSPFSREDYVPAGTVEAQQWSDTADEKFELALANNQHSDNYSMLTVLFALVLFFAALSQRNKTERMARILVSMAIVVAVGGFLLMLTFPVKI